MIAQPKVLPIAAMARRLRVHVRWLRAEAEAGRIPHVRAERAILVDPAAVEAALLARAQTITSDAGEHMITAAAIGADVPDGSMLLSAEDLAGELRVSVRSIRRMDATGELPAPIRLSSRAVRWRRAELRAWIEAGCPPRDEWTWRPPT